MHGGGLAGGGDSGATALYTLLVTGWGRCCVVGLSTELLVS